MRKPYPSDLTDEQWAIIEPLIPVYARWAGPATVDMREVLNAIFYQDRSGCQWDMLPHDLPPKSTVYDYFAQWRDDGTWQGITRRPASGRCGVAAGREPSPECREHRQPDGQGDRGRRRAGLRRGQEAHGAASGTSSWTRWGCCWSCWSRRRRPTTGRPPPRCWAG